MPNFTYSTYFTHFIHSLKRTFMGCVMAVIVSVPLSISAATGAEKGNKTADDSSSYIVDLDQLKQAVELQKAKNELLSAQVQAHEMTLRLNNQEPVSAVATVGRNEQSGALGYQSVASQKPSKTSVVTGKIKPTYTLIRVSFLGDKVTAVMKFNGMTVPVQIGDALDATYQVKSIENTYVILADASGNEKRIYLAEASKNVPEVEKKN
ncbi:hypothetical protein [Cysteiniphilum marinum]|uniref:hypothetical protein n=1 Tax=Cysteiniphilum marinum TaxID=2774191 RepID=UPI001939DDC6|nr:hypothetical protein [Cysteiniphilum marinum]